MGRLSIPSLIILVVLNVLTSGNEEVKLLEDFRSKNANEFNWRYKLSDGRKVSESGSKKTLENGKEILAVRGFYSYIGPDGFKHTVQFDADENGYRPRVIISGLSSKPAETINPSTIRPTPTKSSLLLTAPVSDTLYGPEEAVDFKLLNVLVG